MYDPQFVNLHGGAGADHHRHHATSWLSAEDDDAPPTPSLLSSLSTAAASAAGNVDRALFNDLVQIVPLVQTLIDRKASTSFTRRGSMIYTKTPSRKATEVKGRSVAQSIPARKRKDLGDKDQDKKGGMDLHGAAEDFSMFSSSALLNEKDREELVMLREQVDDLQKKLLEKDEILKSLEASNNEMNSVYDKVDDLKNQISSKDSLLKSTQTQLSDLKIKLADKQAALEKFQWEAITSNKKVEKLQEDLDTVQVEMSSFMLLFESLSKDSYCPCDKEYDVTPYTSHLPDMDDIDMTEMEEARAAYMDAVAVAKEKQDEEAIALAANARLHLQSFVLRTSS